MSHWLYKNSILETPPEGAYGFVYLITNTVTGQKYVGRKYFHQNRKKPLTAKQKREGRVRQSRTITESDWKKYTSSSKPLQEDIAKYGHDKFKFEILIIGNTKGQVNYLEEVAHYKLNALTDPNFYNDSIGPKRYTGMKKDLDFHKKIVETFG